jgi:hypothetical protein
MTIQMEAAKHKLMTAEVSNRMGQTVTFAAMVEWEIKQLGQRAA